MSHVYELVVNMHNGAGNFAVNTFHYELSEGGAAEAFGYADALITSWISTVLSDYTALLGDDVLIDYISAKRISGTGGPSAVTPVASAGTNTNPSISAGIAADESWQSASPLNRAGHTYVPFLYRQAIEADVWSGAFTTAMDNWRDTMLLGLTLAGGLGNADFGLWSRSTQQFNKFTSGQLKPKATLLNKRTLPQI